MPSIYMRPIFRGTDEGRGGGIRRVVDAQKKYLPEYGFTFTEDAESADMLALHGGDYYKAQHGQIMANHCHGLYWDEYSWNKWEYELNGNVIKCLKQADLITAPSEWVSNTIRRGMWATVHTVPNGIDTEEWQPIDSPHEYVLWNKSRIDPICEIDSLVNLARMDQKNSYVTTLGPDKNTPANLTVVGLQSYEAGHLLVQNAGVYLCTTRETFGIGTLEALACGVPVVGWAWGGQRDIIQHKVHGWLCTPGDVEGLREGVEWCLQHKAALRANCIARAKEFEWPGVIAQYADLYTKALESKSNPVRCSIIMPSYNLGRFLPEAIRSAQRQECKGDFEIIIVDDNSTDNSYEIAMQYAAQDRRIRVIKTPSNVYLAGALNYGISQARGEYIMCLDADNILPDNSLNVLSSTLDTDRTLDIVYGRVQFITEDGNVDKEIASDGISVWPPITFNYTDQLSHKNQIPSTCLYRKKIWERVGGYRRRCRTAEDADFWCRATSFGFTASRVSNMVTLIYRNRSDSMSATNKDWPWELWYDNLLRKQPMAVSNRISTNEPVHISVVIPVGPHHTEIVQDALDSLHAQSFRNWECIVVNDSGKDFWTPAWAKVINTSGKEGASAARNLGISMAQGACFLPLDADDYLDSTALAKMWAAWLDHKGYVYSDFYVAPGAGVQPRVVHCGRNACAQILEVLPHPLTGLYPVQAWKDAGGFDKNLRIGEDWAFVAAVTLQGYCGTYIPDPLVYYRTDAGGNREALLQPGNLEQVQRVIQGLGGKDMACGCKKGGNATVNGVQEVLNTSLMATADSSMVAVMSDLVQLEVYAPDIINQRFVGKPTGTSYVFASTGRRKYPYVHRQDAVYFTENFGHLFRLANKSAVGVAD